MEIMSVAREGLTRAHLQASLPYFAVAFLCWSAVMLPSGWGWAIPFLLFSTLAILVLRMSSAELLVITLPIAFYASIFSMRVNIGVSDLFLIPLIMKVLQESRRGQLGRPILRMTSISLILMLALLLAVMLGLIPQLVKGGTVSWPFFYLDTFKLVVSFVYMLTALLVFSAKIRQRDFRFLFVWQLTATAVALAGIAGYFLYATGIDLGLTLSYRATSTFEDPNAFGLYLIASVGIVMASQYLRKGTLFSLSLIPILGAIYFSFSRGALVAVAVSAVMFVVLSIGQPRMRWARRAILLAVLAGAALLLVRADVFQSRRDGSLETDVRFQLWGAAIKVWQDSPIFGSGLGQFRLVSAEYLDTRYAFLAHNTYLSFLAEGGIVGLGLILAILAVIFIALIRNRDYVSRFLLVSFAGVLTMAASLNLQNSRSMWVFLGIAGAWALGGVGNRHSEVPQGESSKKARSTDSVLAESSAPASS